MFGVSFSELGLIMVVALVVLGPSRLPGLVRKVGRWIGKARTMARDFQQQLENEINLEELNRITDLQSKETKPASPAAQDQDATARNSESPPPASGPSDADKSQLSSSGYPYGVPEQAAASPQPGDDTYSHAHADGEAPVADEPAIDEPVEQSAGDRKE